MKRTYLGILLGALVALSVGACSRIEPGHVGIKVVNGGADRGVSDFPAQVGWVVYNPVTTNMFNYPTYIQTIVWTKSTTEGAPVNEEITFTNKDKMAISVDVNLSYHLEAAKVPNFYVTFRSDDLSNWTNGYLHNVARDTFNDHGGRYSIDQIMGDNAQFVKDVRDSLQEKVAPYGVLIDSFGIVGSPRPPQYVQDQINASAHAQQLAIQKQNELAQVQADMAKETAKTETYAKNKILYAEAEARANQMLSNSLSPQLIQKLQLEKWDGKLPQINGGSTNPFVSMSGKP
jgi:regulator of protease activity HflC (stomatin/prohibitin superfamily)